MQNKLSRRAWLRGSALTAGALLLDLPAHGATGYEEPWGLSPTAKLANAPIRLLSNENPYGPPPGVLKAIGESLHRGNRYTRDYAEEVTATIAAIEGVKPENIMLGAGSSELLCLAALSSGVQGKNVVSSELTFMGLVSYAQKLGATWKPVPVTPARQHDLGLFEKAIDADTRVVYIDNPGNPTGALTPHNELKVFAEWASSKALVFIDEAYREYIQVPTLAQARTHTLKQLSIVNENVIVARTMSKVYGMAGIRVGYAIAHASTVKKLQNLQMIPGLTVSSAALSAATAALAGETFVEASRTQNAEVMAYTVRELQRLGFPAANTHTNFLFFDMPGRNPEAFRKYMEDHAILLRASLYSQKPMCRLSLGTRADMEVCITHIEKFVRS